MKKKRKLRMSYNHSFSRTSHIFLLLAVMAGTAARAGDVATGETEYLRAAKVLAAKDVTPDAAQDAVAVLEALAGKGSVASHRKLAEIHYFGDAGYGVDFTAALAHAKVAAVAGDPWSQNLLGTMCEFGKGTAADRSAAEYWYREAGLKGFARAQSNLGKLLREGNPTPARTLDAYVWLRLAENRKDITAIRQLEGFRHTITGNGKTEAETRVLELEKLIGASEKHAVRDKAVK